jgi:hypothetical protein
MYLTRETEAKLLVFLQNTLIEQYNVSPCQAKDFATYLLKTFFSLIGSTAALPIVNAAKKFARNDKALEILYVYAFVVALGVLNVWGFFDFLKYADVNAQINPEKSRIKKNARVAASIALAAVFSFPFSFTYYYYNSSVLLSTQGFICDVIVLSCVFQRIFNVRYADFFLSNHDIRQQVLTVHALLQEHIDSGIRHLAVSQDDRDDFFNSLMFNVDGESQGNSYEFRLANIKLAIHRLIVYGNPYVIKKEKNFLLSSQLPRNALKFVISPILPLAWAYINFNAASQQIGNIISSSILDRLCSFPAVFLNYILETILTQSVLLTTYDSLLSFITYTHQKNISWALFPTSQSVASLWGLITAGLSFSARAQLVQDFTDGTLREILLPLIIILSILSLSASMQGLIFDSMHYLIRKFASGNVRDLFRLNYAFEKLALSVNIASDKQRLEIIEELSVTELLTSADANTHLHKNLLTLSQSIENSESADVSSANNRNTSLSWRSFSLFGCCKRNNNVLLQERNKDEPEKMDLITKENVTPRRNFARHDRCTIL